jgi:D-alanyl-D-alanine carboxypeptidase (penicillin-binding protein 5/6)
VLFAEGQTIGSAKVFGGAEDYVPLKAQGPVRVMVPKNNDERLIARIVYTGPIPAPVAKGQQVGELKVWRGDKVVLQTPLATADSVKKGSLSQRALDAITEMVISRVHAGASRL